MSFSKAVRECCLPEGLRMTHASRVQQVGVGPAGAYAPVGAVCLRGRQDASVWFVLCEVVDVRVKAAAQQQQRP